eukprot:g5675.t1
MNRRSASNSNESNEPGENRTDDATVPPTHSLAPFGHDSIRPDVHNSARSKLTVVCGSNDFHVSFQHHSVGSMPGKRPIEACLAPDSYTLISQLSPTVRNWPILARCSNRRKIHQFKNPKGEGKVFNFLLIDEDSDEIQCTAFNEAAIHLFSIIEIGNVYLISKGDLENRSKFCCLDHNYQIYLRTSSSVDLIDEQSLRRKIPFINTSKCISIKEIRKLPMGEVVDVIGVITEVEPTEEKTIGSREVPMKNIHIRDDKNDTIRMTLWDGSAGEIGEEIDKLIIDGQTPMIAAKGVKIGFFNGVTLNSTYRSWFQLDPSISETDLVREKAMRLTNSRRVHSVLQLDKKIYTNTLSIADVSPNLIQPGELAYYNVVAKVASIRYNSMYYALCPLQRNGERCRKKLMEEDENFRCKTCGKVVEKPKLKYSLSLELKDDTGSCSAMAYDVGKEIIGISAKQLRFIKSTPTFKSLIDSVLNKYRAFRMRSTLEERQADFRLKTLVIHYEEIGSTNACVSSMHGSERYDRGVTGAPMGAQKEPRRTYPDAVPIAMPSDFDTDPTYGP